MIAWSPLSIAASVTIGAVAKGRGHRTGASTSARPQASTRVVATALGAGEPGRCPEGSRTRRQWPRSFFTGARFAFGSQNASSLLKLLKDDLFIWEPSKFSYEPGSKARHAPHPRSTGFVRLGPDSWKRRRRTRHTRRERMVRSQRKNLGTARAKVFLGLARGLVQAAPDPGGPSVHRIRFGGEIEVVTRGEPPDHGPATTRRHRAVRPERHSDPFRRTNAPNS